MYVLFKLLSLLSCVLNQSAFIYCDKIDSIIGYSNGPHRGRYTGQIERGELVIPRRVHEDGSFNTYELAQFYDRGQMTYRDKRSDMRLHLLLPFSDIDHHVELEPYHDFISPQMIIERRAIDAEPSDSLNDGNIKFSSPDRHQCHYRGTIRGQKNSRAALSLCDGVVGYIMTNNGKYFIEPLDEDKPWFDGQHVHIIYRSNPEAKTRPQVKEERSCATSDDWENVWTDRLTRLQNLKAVDDSASLEETPQNGEPSSSSHSIHRYMEIAMVADRSFLDYHKNANHEQYLLTVANIASDLFHDASVGNQIDLVVVRMILLERQEKEVDLHINTDAEDTLKSFAGWVAKLSPSDPQHPNHFDIGVLVTRYDICSKDGDCNVVGLAYVASACERKDAGCITEDNGIGLGDTIAHEIGHMLGCAHDSKDISGCEPTAKDGSTYVMAAVSTGSGTYSWSECSKKFITTFFESGLGECFLNNPKNPPDKYKFPNMLPGTVYGTDFQCSLAFPGSGVCSTNPDVCERLWCRVGEKCMSRTGSAEGTKCAEGKWCIKHKCVEMGTRGSAVSGGWSDWGLMSKCSRSCGGGVQISERECNNPAPENGGRYCIGERKKFSICNTKPCDKSKPSFRAVQCAKYDGDLSVNGVAHKWKPYTRQDLDSCALYCLNDKNVFYKLSPTVENGTPCQVETNNICIGGVCRKVGCDWTIDSNAVEDVCGVCKGGGTDCTQIQGTYNEQGKRGYTKVVTIPKGSRNIVVQELQGNMNILAVKLPLSSSYCLNDENTENLDGDYSCAGVNMVYKHVADKMEKLEIRNAIEEDLEIQYVFFQPDNPGVEYSYYVDQPNKSYTPNYFWDNVEWAECDVKCGGGTQVSEASCIEDRSGKVDDKFCEGIQRPPAKSQMCNTTPCITKWRVTQWSKCNCCDGLMRRKIQCVRASQKFSDYIRTELKECKGKAPVQTKKCSRPKNCPKNCNKSKSSKKSSKTSVSLEERFKIIDEFVDHELVHYLWNDWNLPDESEVESDEGSDDVYEVVSETMFGDSEIQDEENREKRTCGENGSVCEETKFTTPKPGSIIIDEIPNPEIIIHEMPVQNDLVLSNVSGVNI